MKCPFCSHDLPAVANYCSRCGKQIRPNAAKATTAAALLDEVDEYLQTVREWGRYWREAGRPPGAREQLREKLEHYAKLTGRVRDDWECPHEDRKRAKALSNKCDMVRLILSSEKNETLWSRYDDYTGDKPAMKWLKQR